MMRDKNPVMPVFWRNTKVIEVDWEAKVLYFEFLGEYATKGVFRMDASRLLVPAGYTGKAFIHAAMDRGMTAAFVMDTFIQDTGVNQYIKNMLMDPCEWAPKVPKGVVSLKYSPLWIPNKNERRTLNID